MHPDALPLTDAQRRKLSEMMYWAFLEMRMLGHSGQAKQAADLADAFHNVPTGMWHPNFDLKYFRDCFLVPYQLQHPENRPCNYLALVEEVISMKD